MPESAQQSSLFGFNKGITLLSYVPKKGKNVILVSSLYKTDAIDLSTGKQQKPEVITFYNTTKAGVETSDKTLYKTQDAGRCSFFIACIIKAGINSQVIVIGNDLEPVKRRIFLKIFSHQL